MHPKYADRLAKIYVAYLIKDKDKAKEWASRVVPKDCVSEVAALAKQKLEKMGYKVLV